MPLIKIARTNYFDRWLISLKDRRARAFINIHLKRLQTGNFGIIRSVGQGIYEKKLDYGPGYWLYYLNLSSQSVLFLCGGNKSTQDRDILRAKMIKKGLS